MRALSDFMNLFFLNLVTLLCSVPIVTAGAALSSMHYCIWKILEGEDDKLVRKFFAAFKGNLRSSTPVWLVVFALAAFFAFDLYVLPRQGGGELKPLMIGVYVGWIILLALFVWLFPLLAKFENRFSATWKNALILAVGKFPRTIAMMAITAVIPVVLVLDLHLLPLLFVCGVSLPGYLCALFYRPVLQKIIDSSEKKEEEA